MTAPQSLLSLLPPAAPAVPGLPTGIDALDVALGGGLPRGRLTEVVGTGARGSGRTTLLRRMAEEAIAGAGWVAYIDASRTLAPRDWAHLGAHEGLWVIRPRDPARAAWCADVLLRCGAFALVVLDSGPPLPKAIAVRLTRLARESNAAFVVTRDEETSAGGAGSAMRNSLGTAVRLRVARGSGEPGGGRRRSCAAPRSFVVVVEKGGPRKTVEVSCAIAVARRLCAHPQIPDRRGVAQREKGRSGRERRTATATVHAGDGGTPILADRAPDEPLPASLPRKRRCAEPDYGRAPRGHGRARALG